MEALSKQHQRELTESRREMMSLSEKYSSKCLEASNLETKLDALATKLRDANRSLEAKRSDGKQEAFKVSILPY